MRVLNDLAGLARFAAGLGAFTRDVVTLGQARAHVQRAMDEREARFVRKIDRAIFGHPRSPYLWMMRQAGCGLDDIRQMTMQRGVEATLHALRDAGVYVTFSEFKCRQPLRRGGATLTPVEHDFDNPWITPHFHSRSGGSSGTPTRIIVDLDHLAETAPHHRLWFEDQSWMERPLWLWSSGETSVANRLLMCARYGKRVSRWYCSARPRGVKDKLAAGVVHRLVRSATGIPRPLPAPVGQAAAIARDLVRARKSGVRPCLITSPSQAIHIVIAAAADGESLDGAAFLLGGEPLTAARHATIEASGARAVPTYGFSEGGNVGSQCRAAPAVDDIHVSLDAYAVITRPHHAAEDTCVDALLLTSLRPSCPKVLFNTEVGDYATVTSGRCGCLFDECGYHQHLHTIRSFEKLTGVGVTFIGADLFDVMERVLPAHFGGSAIDYQLVEQQDERGLPRYRLLVSPGVGQIDERLVCDAFLRELGRRWSVYRLMASVWEQAGVLEVARERPLPTRAGKVLPFRTLGAH